MADVKYLTISSLRGGLNDADPPLALESDSCTLAENVEFFNTTLGERRLGCVAINMEGTVIGSDDDPSAIFGTGADQVSWAGRHLPTNDQRDAELWQLESPSDYTTTGGNTGELFRRTPDGWLRVLFDHSIETRVAENAHRISAVSLHGKYFIAARSELVDIASATPVGTYDRIMVWDGTHLRLAGQSAPVLAPTGADTGVGAFASTRYYRVRFVTVSGSTVLLRSEPSPVLTFAPSGAGTGVIVTRPASAGAEHETHWELEASTDNANFYMIARTIMATTTVTDSAVFATGYATGTLSEDLTSYSLIPSGKYLSVDSDRLLIAGNWETPAYASRLWWTPVFGNTGVGNDERLDMTVNPFIDLDGYEGGEITGLSRAVNGYTFVFKFSHIYKVARTGQRRSAYSAIPITKDRGAFPGSLVEAVDEAGSPAQYFLDPKIGPMRIGNNGLEWCGQDVRNFWTRVNQSAIVPCHGVFYQAKNQVHYWVAVDGADYPNAKIVVHCTEIKSDANGARDGWVTVPVGDRIADAHCSVMFSNNVDSIDPRNQLLVPFIGKRAWIVGSTTIYDLIQQCDTGPTDAFTTGDDDAYYYGRIQTRPIVPAGIMNKCGVLSACVVASSLQGANNSLYIQGVKDFGTDSLLTGTVFTPSPSGEEIVIKTLDDFSFSEAKAIQITFGDLDETVLPTASWELHSFSMKVRMEQTS